MSLVDYASSEEEEEESVPTNKEQTQISSRPSDKQHKGSHSSAAPVMKLPDALLLLNAANVTSHLGKVPRGNLPHLRTVPDTGKGLLVPPQLSGRSNVVTEDISKLFSRKNCDTCLNRSDSSL